MGTRGLVGLIIAGKRHAIYNHYDSYPSGLGNDIIKFILSLTPEQWDEMTKILQEVVVSHTIYSSGTLTCSTWVHRAPSEDCCHQRKCPGWCFEIQWVDSANPIDPELKQRYVALGYNKNEFHEWQPYSWDQLLNGVQGTRVLEEIKAGRLKHAVEYGNRPIKQSSDRATIC